MGNSYSKKYFMSAALKYMMKHALGKINDAKSDKFEPTDILWVLTVPGSAFFLLSFVQVSNLNLSNMGQPSETNHAEVGYRGKNLASKFFTNVFQFFTWIELIIIYFFLNHTNIKTLLSLRLDFVSFLASCDLLWVNYLSRLQ